MNENSDLLDYFGGDDLASSVWEGKYAQEGEVTPDDMHRRMAKEFARIDGKFPESPIGNKSSRKLSEYGRDRKQTTEEGVYQLFKNFKYISPQGSVMSQLGNTKSIGSLSNCFVIGQPEDSYGGIFKKDEEMAQLEKRRGGVGVDISTLRPSGTETTNAAKTSTGAVSFMHRYSNTTREVAQNGRRGALMISIDIRHPDVMDFIKVKEDLTQVTGANISVMVRDDFMEAVKKDGDYILRFPCTAEVDENFAMSEHVPYNEPQKCNYIKSDDTIIDLQYVKIKAKEYWEALNNAAHKSAEPGIIFIDKHWNYSPDGVYLQYKGVTTNPCGEIFMQAYDACRLIALNLFSFVKNPFTKDAEVDFDLLYKTAYEQMRLADNLIDLEVEKIDAILAKIEADPETDDVKKREKELWSNIKRVASSGRRAGCGFTALGDMLAALGLKYDSDEALEIVGEVMSTKMRGELDCTIDLAVIRGTFDGWDYNTEWIDASSYGLDVSGANDFYDALLANFPEQAKRMMKYGRRNVSWSTVAPTGSLSMLSQTTSGLEPLFAGFYIRRKKVNAGEDVRVDFTDDNGDTWMEFSVLHPKFKEWLDYTFGKHNNEARGYDFSKEELEQSFEISPWYKSTAPDIDWIKRVQMQTIIQQYTTHSISSTINLPKSVKVEEVSEIYEKSWDLGLKGVTVYRDGSRSGVLVNNTDKEESFDYKDAPKRPKDLPVEVYTTVSQGIKWNVFVGLFNDRPYEVFATPHLTNKTSLTLHKVKRGVYNLLEDGEVYAEDIMSEMGDMQEAMTRLISTSLRHGADIKFIVEQLNKTSGDITSFTKAIARVLKRYIPDGSESTVTCNDCGSDDVIFEEGCSKCRSCGSSKCG